MKLRDGFVIGDRYQVDGLIANGRRVRVYSAVSGPNGPGAVVARVARHAEGATGDEIVAGRRQLANEWLALRHLHDKATSAVPLPIELVRMYPGDPDVRRAMLADRASIADEPYLIVQRVAGQRLSEIVRRGRLDEDRALALALRAVLLVGAAARVGLAFSGIDATDLIVDVAGENVCLVDVSRLGPRPGARVGQADRVDLGQEPMPPGFGRMLVSLLSGATAPEWAADIESRGRWDELLATRRVPVELRSLVLGSLGYSEALDASVERVEDRLRALTRTRRSVVYDHPARKRDLQSPVGIGDVLAERFEVTGELAQGARGFILIARDHRGEGEVLLKLNKYVYDAAADFALELPTRRLELEHEFDIMRRFASTSSLLAQPVACVLDAGQGPWFDLAPSLKPGEPVIAMRRVRGRPLLDLLPYPLEGVRGASIPANRLAPMFVMRVVTRVAALLAELHEAGYLFQDLKPENIIYDPASENIYLVDLASVCPRGADGHLRRDHVAFGVQTHGFAAPEFADLWERSDARFDLYSLGATAYHLLTGVNPERVALERGEEYPVLPDELLQAAPSPVAAVVRRCLSSVEHRFADARAVARAADAARLWMSRSRPLDVRDARATFDESSVCVSWTMPSDPRVTGVLVTRHRGEEVDTIVDGEPVTEVSDPVTPGNSEASTYVVTTTLLRGGEALRSRGVVVRVGAHPAPITFAVEPWFGANRLEVRVPPHATGARVVARTDRPPADPDDGVSIEVSGPGQFEHIAPPSGRVFYAAFAEYGGAWSAPRFGDAAPLPPLDDPGEVRVTQSESGVRVEWDHPVMGARVAVDGAEASVGPAIGACEVQLAGIERGATVDLELRVERMGVVSAPLFSATIVRWPPSPDVRCFEGPGRVVFELPEVTASVRGYAIFDATGRPLATTTETRAIVTVAGGRLAHCVVRAVVDADGGGPQTRVQCVPSDVEVPLALVVERDQLPVRLRLGLDASAASWTGRWGLRVVADDGRVVLDFDDVLTAATDASGIPAWCVEDDAAVPGTTTSWTARLIAPDSTVVATPSVSARVLEILEPPVLEAALAAVVVPAAADERGLDRVDVRVVRCDETQVLRDAALPATIGLEPAETVDVAWRRAVRGAPMPWSALTRVITLQRPPRPVTGDAAATAAGVRIAWTPADERPASWRVHASDNGRLVYEGDDREAVDVAATSSSGYEVFAVRDGLDSAPLMLTTRRGHETAAITTAAPSPPDRLADAHLRVDVRVLRARRRSIVEWFGDGTERVVAVLSAQTLEVADQLAARLDDAGTAWPVASGVVGGMVVSTRRAVVPCRIPSGHAAVVVSCPTPRGGGWRRVAGVDTAEPAVLVGVAATHAERLRVLPVRGALDPSKARLRVMRVDGQMRELTLDELTPLRVSGTGAGAGVLSVGAALEEAVALTLYGGAPAPVAVPLVAAEEPSAVRTRLYVDAARAALRHVLGAAVVRLGGVVARVSVAAEAHVDALIGGEHTIVRASQVDVSAGGRLRAVWSIQRGGRGTAVRRTVRLDVPTDVFDSVPRALVEAWAGMLADRPIRASTAAP